MTLIIHSHHLCLSVLVISEPPLELPGCADGDSAPHRTAQSVTMETLHPPDSAAGPAEFTSRYKHSQTHGCISAGLSIHRFILHRPGAREAGGPLGT